MKRFLAILLVCLVMCAACGMSASAAAKKGFDPNAIKQCMLINDTKGITGYGHNGVILIDENGYAKFYSYRLSGLLKVSFSPAQVQQFLKDGFPYPQSKFQFDRVVAFPVSLEEGRRMYDYVETTEFKEFGRYASFWSSVWPVQNDNCTTVAHNTLKAGSNKYAFYYPFGLPNSGYYTLQMRLFFRGVPFTTYHPEGEKPVDREVDPNQ